MPDSEILEPVTETRSEGAVFEVREPVPGDAAGVRAVLESAWLGAAAQYGKGAGRIRGADVREFFKDPASVEAVLAASFAPNVSSLVHRVAVCAGEIVGYLRITRHATMGELKTAALLPGLQGRGAGYAMFRDATSSPFDRSRPLWADFPAYDEYARKALVRWGFDPSTLSIVPGVHSAFPAAKAQALRMTWNPQSAKHAG